jgi:hypothetical protein
MPGMMLDEVFSRLQPAPVGRVSMKSGSVANYSGQGWRERRTRDADARLVRIIDFERALSRLTEEHQSILLLTDREHPDSRAVCVS